MTEFLASVVPTRLAALIPVCLDIAHTCFRTKGSEQLISNDTHSNTSNYKFTYSVEIVPICKDDLVVVPKPLAKSWGNIS